MSKFGSISSPDLKSTTRKRSAHKFQQDFQNEKNLDTLKEFLIESQAKELQNKQKLYSIKRENDSLKEQLQELEAQRKKLEVARDVNQKFFKKNEGEIYNLKRPLDENPCITESINSPEAQDSLRKKMQEVIQECRQEIDAHLERVPNFQEVLQSDEVSLMKLLELMRSQVMIYQEEMVQKEKVYRTMQDRYMREFHILAEQHRTIRSKINDLAQDKKADMMRKYALERKIAYLEADVELGNGYLNAQKLALTAAQEVNFKIQKLDSTKSLNALSSKIQRKIAATKPI